MEKYKTSIEEQYGIRKEQFHAKLLDIDYNIGMVISEIKDCMNKLTYTGVQLTVLNQVINGLEDKKKKILTLSEEAWKNIEER